jgi:hypothetical protein
VAVGVVHRLEAVEVEQDDGPVQVAGERPVERGQEGRAVRQAGERVVQRLVLAQQRLPAQAAGGGPRDDGEDEPQQAEAPGERT